MQESVSGLAEEARLERGLPRLTTVGEVGAWLQQRHGARPFDAGEELMAQVHGDPHRLLRRDDLAGAWAVEGARVAAELAGPQDLAHLSPDDPDEVEDGLRDLGEPVAEVARLLHRMERAELVLVLVTATPSGVVDDFFVLGPGQVLVEDLWASTRVLPSSQGRPLSAAYARACLVAGPADRS